MRLLGVAAVAAAVLGGCASGGASPLGNAVSNWLPGDTSAAERAEAIEFATLAVDTEDRAGVVVLGAMAGPATYWPTGNEGMLVLYHEGLQATSGLREDLLDTRFLPLGGETPHAPDFVPWRQASPEPFRLERRWQTADGLPRQLGARGTLACGEATAHELPLGPRTLEPCTMQLAWEDGSHTRAVLWRDAETQRLWAGDSVPWPDGPRIRWRVARAWW
ncbi:hypothetical protein KG088_10450 [Halomonas sp. TRM85114]|uniref:hypothetical protein n=1 Tax=Halomonas jincaotanensis TaxID=2810616 RepID=UPI001BD5CE75|nr:hypothetical protein [Halomonas jincaotanensis]MBS9404051.1 hypothetical protein [Halomonas jincaotanensis]